MTAYQLLHGHVGHTSEGWLGTSIRSIGKGTEILSLWYKRARARRRLVDLDDRILSDIGMTRFEAEQEYRKFFWQA